MSCFRGICLLLLALAQAQAGQPNVLFIAVDDLRPQLNCYGKTFMHTPNIDKLADRGVLFEHAYCMVPTCGASRASLMTSLRPTPTRFVNYLTWAERDAAGVTTLNTQFKNHGYTTISLGKVFHHPEDNTQGWSELPWRSSLNDYKDLAANQRAIAEHRRKYPERKRVNGLPFEAGDADDDEYRDGQNAVKAIEYLQRFSKQEKQPFFLAVGFHKPHLPFLAPRKYWDLYDSSKIDIPDNYWPPKNVPQIALHNSGELRNYAAIPPEGPVDRPTARKLIHGYYACVSFTDAQIGRILSSLEELGLADNTVVILWGDHGWQLGEHGLWNKHSCFETSMHAPLIIAAPTTKAVKPGTRVSALTEFIDIYPTLCELAGVPTPEHVEGRSVVPLMKDPATPWKQYAVGRFNAGDTIRSSRYRFTEYTTKAGEFQARMLYDHRTDPNENSNIAEQSGQETKAQELAEQLSQRKGRTLPPK